MAELESSRSLSLESKLLRDSNAACDEERQDSESMPSRRSTTIDQEVPVDPEALDADAEALERAPTTGEPYTIFSKSQKNFIVFIAAFAGMFSPLAGNIYFPALNEVAGDLHVSSELINLTLTSYLIFQGLAPSMYHAPPTEPRTDLAFQL
jgi:hypothetical protein